MEKITCNIIRSRRRTLALQITPEGEVIVRAPMLTFNWQINSFLEKTRGWIEKKLAQIEKKKLIPRPKIEDGSTLPLLGNTYPIIFKPAAKTRLLFQNAFIISATTHIKAKNLVEKFYKKAAKQYFEKRLTHFASTYKLTYRSMKLSSAKTRWGSCSVRKTINLNWKLMLAPREIVDYVIAHELSHTVHMNHSNRFWDHVEKIFPNHHQYKKWLKENGRSLSIR